MKKENNISIQHFFTDSLFVLPAQNPPIVNDIKSEQKQILVLYQDDKDQQELLDLLKKILIAIQLDIDKDIILVRSKKEDLYSFIRMRTKIEIKQILVFGLNAKQLGLNIQAELYQILSFEACQFLFVDALSKIATDQKLKGALWTCLQSMFLK